LTGRFHFDGAIVAGGTAIQVSGPVRWEDDEGGAVVHAQLTQHEAVARADSVYTPRGAGTWFATLIVVEGTFHNGATDAEASATVTLTNGENEEYPPWADRVILHGG